MSEASLRYAGWRVVIACFAMTFFGFGFGFYGLSVYLAALTIRDGTDAPRIAVSTVSVAVTGNSFGPSLLGLLRDATGGYAVPIVVCMAIEVVAIVMILLRVGPAKVVAAAKTHCGLR